ncbi:hypothetical protein [Polaribacter sp.]|uniref:hypothetical protein n=1 Tax=Polaribacter sp. TaxID=1920175 RepID=UPI004047B3BA
MKKLFYLLIVCFLACKPESKENVSVKNSQSQTVIIDNNAPKPSHKDFELIIKKIN